MGDVEQIVTLYIEEEVTPRLLDDIAHTMEEGMKAGIRTGENPVRPDYGYNYGDLYRSLHANPVGKDIISAKYGVYYGEFIQYGTKRGIKPVDFFGTGLKHIKEKYGA